MKVGIIGVGAVGSSCAIALMQRGSAREIVLVDKTAARSRAVALERASPKSREPASSLE